MYSVAPAMRSSSRYREPMRKRYLVGFAVLLAIAALTPFIRRTFYPTALERIQNFDRSGGTRKAAVFIGDSLVELASFSSTICGLPVINVGQSGARSGDVLQFIDQMGQMQFSPALLVISVGINDAIAPDSQPFAKAYPEIVRRARPLAGKVFVVSLAPIANSGSIASRVDRSRLPDVAETIRQTAGEYSIPMIDVSTLNTRGSPLSDDGVHLSPDGSIHWTNTIENAVSRQCP
jgi:GDSL-like Lipase/Acylhydrolase family